MKTSDQLRHQIIDRLMAEATVNMEDTAINILEKMSTQIVAIVGEGGFNSLYTRGIAFNQILFPWLDAAPPSIQPDDHRFAGLKISFDRQTPAQVDDASRLLIFTLTDILASLIGEQLTIDILRLVLGNDILENPVINDGSADPGIGKRSLYQSVPWSFVRSRQHRYPRTKTYGCYSKQTNNWSSRLSRHIKWLNKFK